MDYLARTIGLPLVCGCIKTESNEWQCCDYHRGFNDGYDAAETCDCACHRLGSEMIAADCPCRTDPDCPVCEPGEYVCRAHSEGYPSVTTDD